MNLVKTLARIDLNQFLQNLKKRKLRKNLFYINFPLKTPDKLKFRFSSSLTVL